MHVDISDHKSALLINVSSLPYQTSEEDITSYFERQGDKAEVCSVQIHGDGRATIKLIGLTEEGIVSHQYYPICYSIALIFHVCMNRANQITDTDATQDKQAESKCGNNDPNSTRPPSRRSGLN